ncbi:MAG: hypothetical protein IJ518_00225 [Clostridia bacterium]|nr:hypothetical protein [Clostridia bacterium]
MKLGEWNGLVHRLPPETPVVFLCDGTKALEPGDYCDGLAVKPSEMWEGDGWRPCVLVELGEPF